MSIKIEGGGSAENVVKAGTSNQLLYNDKEILLKENFLNLVYPVGSIYWSSNNTNPGTLFGGTWTQIKDKFILAAGDSYSNGATGGAATVTLTVSNMPSHSHTIGGSTGNTQPTFTGTAVTSGANSRGHTHNFEHKHTTGNQSANPTFSGSHSHRHQVYNSSETDYPLTYFWDLYAGAVGGRYNAGNMRSTNDSGYIYTDTKTITISGTTSGNHTHTTNSLMNTSGTAITNTGTESQNHTHSVTASGTVQNHNHTLPDNTGTNGSGSSFSILPPYIVKYCWERTA